MSFLREIKNIFFYHYRIPASEKQIVFYAEHEGYYAYFEGLIEELTQTHDQSVVYITSDPNDPVLNRHHPKVHPLYLKQLLPFFMAFVACRVFVMTLTELNVYHLKRSMHPVHYVYVFHSLVSTHMMYTEKAFDHYDTILCPGPYHKEELAKREQQHSLRHKTLVEAGYYRLERVRAAFNKKAPLPAVKQKPFILVAPSWGVGNVLETCGERLVDLLLAQGYQVVVRPHPETIRRTPVVVEGLEKRFANHPNFSLETSVASDDSLLAADVLICDCSGVALEYALGTERPVLFLDVPYKIHHAAYAELGMEPFELSTRPVIGRLVSPDNNEAILQALNELISQRQTYREKIRKVRDENVFNFGNSSKVGAETILEILNTPQKKLGSV